MWKASFIGALLAIHLAIALGQGYGNIEDDSEPQKPIPPSQQQISSLPQYESEPVISSDGYGLPPNSNFANKPSPQNAASQNQDYWWQNQNAFQKPSGHPGVEQLGQNAPAPQPKPQGNRNPNAYNPSSPSQNSYQPPPQAPARPQNNNNQFQQNSPSFGAPSNPSSENFGWNGPSQSQGQAASQPSGFNAPPPSPPNNFGEPKPPLINVAFECMLLNKADCHKGARPRPTPTDFQPQEPYNQPSGGYNPPPKPNQGYRPPQQQQQAQAPQKPFQQLQANPVPPPSGFYKPPQSQEPRDPVPYENAPGNSPSNQNYQPQFQPESAPGSAFQLGPRPNSYQPPPPSQPQQSYNKPYSPPQAPSRPFNNEQQFQNNAQGLRPNNNNNNNNQQQQPQNYDDQLPYPGCPAAMLCVQEDRCNLIGVIEEAPLRLSASEKAHRVALSRCSEPGTGVEGICCRDPNYKDPWPDMQGGGGGGNHQHHHEDKGQGGSGNKPQSFGQAQSQPQAPSNNFRNPYAGARRNTNVTNSKLPSKTEFQRCSSGEACIIAYKCQDGFLKSSQEKKAIIEQDRENVNHNKNVKKCKEDIFKNVFVCCNLGSPVTETRPQDARFTSTRTTLTTTNRPKQTTPVSISSTNPITSTPKEGIYKNNYLLTNTLAPTQTAELEIPDVTESSLITGLGLRFHSHLHTKSAVKANAAKPNPYSESSQPAIIPLNSSSPDVELINESNDTVKVSGNFTEKSSNSIELLGSASNTKSVNQTVDFGSYEVEVRFDAVNSSSIDKDSKIPSTNSTQKLQTQNESLKNSTVEVFAKVDVNKVPERVPLSEEYSTYPPFGFIFKGQDLYIPEVNVPSQNFLPPLYNFGANKEDILVEDGVGMTEDDLTETTTVSDIDSSLG